MGAPLTGTQRNLNRTTSDRYETAASMLRLLCATAICLVALSALLVPSASAVNFDPEPFGDIKDVEYANGNIYVGGDIRWVGTRTGSFAPMNGSSYSTLMSTFPKVEGGGIRTSVPDGAGGWYVGGNFTRVGSGVTAHAYLAHIAFDGTNYFVDDSFNFAPNGAVDKLRKYGTKLWVTGSMSEINSNGVNAGDFGVWSIDLSGGIPVISVYEIVRENVSEGSPTDFVIVSPEFQTTRKIFTIHSFLGEGSRMRCTASPTSCSDQNQYTNNGQLKTIELMGTTILLGGDFTEIKRTSEFVYNSFTNFVAVDSTTGILDTTTLPGISTDGAIHAMTLDTSASPSRLYLGGSFNNVTVGANAGEPRQHIAAINLSSFPKELDTDFNPTTNIEDGEVTTIYPYAGSVYVGGTFRTNPDDAVANDFDDFAFKVPSSCTNCGRDTNFHPRVSGPVTTFLRTSNSGGQLLIGGYLAGANTERAENLLAYTYDGQRITQFDAGTDRTVWDIETSSDSSRIFIGGEFTKVRETGQTWPGATNRDHIAALSISDATPGSLDTDFVDNLSYRGGNNYVTTLLADGPRLYAGGGDPAAGLANNADGFVDVLDSADGNRVDQSITTHRYNFSANTYISANATVRALEKRGDVLFVGGSFNAIRYSNGSPVSRNFIAGVTLEPSGSLTPGIPTGIDSGTYFTDDPAQNFTASGQMGSNSAIWVSELEVVGNVLFWGGQSFSTAAPFGYTRLDDATATRFTSISSGTSFGANVMSLVASVDGRFVYVGGSFSPLRINSTSHVARFDMQTMDFSDSTNFPIDVAPTSALSVTPTDLAIMTWQAPYQFNTKASQLLLINTGAQLTNLAYTGFNNDWSPNDDFGFTFEVNDPDSALPVGFEIQIDNNDDFSSPEELIQQVGTVGTNAFTVTRTDYPEGEWFWRIRGFDSNSAATDWSTGPSIKIDKTQPATVGPIAITDWIWTTNIVPISFTPITEAGPIGAPIQKYYYCVTQDAFCSGSQLSFTQPAGTGLFTTSLTVNPSLVTGTTYNFCMVAADAADNRSSTYTCENFGVDTEIPTAFAVRAGNSPTISATATNSDTWDANWDASNDAASGLEKYTYCFTSIANNVGCTGTPYASGVAAPGDTEVHNSSSIPANGASFYFCIKAIDFSGRYRGVCTGRVDVDRSPPNVNTPPVDGNATRFTKTPSMTPTWTNSSGAATFDYCLKATNKTGCAAPDGDANAAPVRWTSNGASTYINYLAIPSAANGATYNFCIRAVDAAGNASGESCAPGLLFDNAAPLPPMPLDRPDISTSTLEDTDWTTRTSGIHAIWNTGQDVLPSGLAMSGISKYEYCTSATSTILTCLTYKQAGAGPGVNAGNPAWGSATEPDAIPNDESRYMCVRTIDKAGNQSPLQCSDGITNDSANPTVESPTDGTTVNDVEYVADNTYMSLTWPAGYDAKSGIEKYLVCFSKEVASASCSGSTKLLNFTDVGNVLTKTIMPASGQYPMPDGTQYHGCLKAYDRAGRDAIEKCSDGVIVDTHAYAPTTVNDGSGNGDADYSNSTNYLFGNWTAVVDEYSGRDRYEYCFTTSSTGSDCATTATSPWIASQMTISPMIPPTALALADGQTYYTCVKTVDEVGNEGQRCSDGTVVDTVAPTAAMNTINGAAGTITITGSISDPLPASGVTSVNVQYTVNSGAPQTACLASVSGTTWTCNWNTNGLKNDAYVLNFRAYDRAGNVAVGTPQTVTLDNQPNAPTGLEVVSHTIVGAFPKVTLAWLPSTDVDNITPIGMYKVRVRRQDAASGAPWITWNVARDLAVDNTNQARQHLTLFGDLDPGASYDMDVAALDPDGNTSTYESFGVVTIPQSPAQMGAKQVNADGVENSCGSATDRCTYTAGASVRVAGSVLPFVFTAGTDVQLDIMRFSNDTWNLLDTDTHAVASSGQYLFNMKDLPKGTYKADLTYRDSASPYATAASASTQFKIG